MNRICAIFFLFSIVINGLAQNVAINATGTTPDPSAMLDVSSVTSGMLIPRITTAQRTAIAAPATGLLVYDTSFGAFWYYDGAVWRPLVTNATGWLTSGNTLTAAGIFGTLNGFDVRFFSNNTERMRLQSGGVFGIGTTTPSTSNLGLASVDKLNVNSNTTAASTGMVEMGNSNSNGLALITGNSSATNAFNTLYSFHNYTGNTFQPCAIIGQISTNNGTGAGIGVRGDGFSSTHIGVRGSIPTNVGTWNGFGGLFTGGLGYANGLYNLSDERVKKDVKNIVDPLKIIQGLRGVYYKYNTDVLVNSKGDERVYIGFLAQQVEKVCPEIVATKKIPLGNENGPAKGFEPSNENLFDAKVVDYVQLVPVLVEAIKEQQKQIEDLKSELNALKK